MIADSAARYRYPSRPDARTQVLDIAGTIRWRRWTKAAREWTSSYENTDRDHALVWGAAAPFSILTAAAWPDENWYDGEPDRFSQLACRLWLPVLDVENVDIP